MTQAALSTEQRDIEDLMLVTAWALNRADPDSELATRARRLRCSISRQALSEPERDE